MIPRMAPFEENGLLIYRFIQTQSSHSVYFLSSTVGSRTYVGYSVNPFHRLRQHNGELVGGAKRTRIGRPYRIVCIVTGFPTENAALSFEWLWHQLRRGPRKKQRKHVKIVDPSEALTVLFSRQWTSKSPPRYSFPLTLFWIAQPSHQYPHPEFICQPQPNIHPGWIVFTGYYHPGLPAQARPRLELEIIPSEHKDNEENEEEIELIIIPSN
jgi:predicted GIY-YIG superfamily endonuclease